MHHCKLLIVESDCVYLEIISRFFSFYNYTVYSAASYSEGFKLFSVHHPHCILMDYRFSKGDAES